MAAIGVFILCAVAIARYPLLILFIFVAYETMNGLASRQFMNDLKASVGGVNIYVNDLLFAVSFLFSIIGIFAFTFSSRASTFPRETRWVLRLVTVLMIFFLGKLAVGFAEGVPLDTLVRRFSLDAQFVYLFVPLMFLKGEVTLRKLLYFIVACSLVFPLAQPFLYGSADQVSLQEGQGGTLRLGFGNANLLLMMGVFAFWVWGRAIALSALPLAGIAMLAQRSGYLAIGICLVMLSIQKKQSVKFFALLAAVGAALIVALFVIQASTSVPVIDKATERLTQVFERTKTTSARIEVIPQAMGEVIKRPFIGYSYRELHILWQKQDEDAFAFNMIRPHNFVLSWLLRTGFLGTAILFTIIILLFRMAWRMSKSPQTHHVGMFLNASLLFFVIFSLMNTSFTSAGYIFWLLAGVTMWYTKQTEAVLSLAVPRKRLSPLPYAPRLKQQ